MVAFVGATILGFCLANVHPDFIWDKQARQIVELETRLDACEKAE